MTARGPLFAFSHYAAWAGGILLPLAETVRRWGSGHYLFWVDDYLIGAALLLAAWRTGRDAERGRLWLAAAWGFACGIGWQSLVGHWLGLGTPDVSGIDHRLVLAALALAELLAILGLCGSMAGAGRD